MYFVLNFFLSIICEFLNQEFGFLELFTGNNLITITMFCCFSLEIKMKINNGSYFRKKMFFKNFLYGSKKKTVGVDLRVINFDD